MRDYFFQLVDLVSQEIETFHQEISMREDRINALNKNLAHATAMIPW